MIVKNNSDKVIFTMIPQLGNSLMGSMAPSATLAIDSKAKAMKAAGEDVCTMSAGEPDCPTFAPIIQAAIEALQKGKTGYTPASGIPDLKKACAEKLQRENGIETKMEQIIVSPGAKYSCFATIAALCGPGDEVIIPAPYWLSYPEMVRGVGAKPVFIPARTENNYEIDPAEFEGAITDKTRLLVLNSPSNPTGAVYRRQTLEKIAEIVIRKDIMVLSDEIYEKLTYDDALPHVSIGSFSKAINDRTITVNGFSKTYAMTGWRLGYLSAPQWLTKKIAALQSHTTSNPTTFAQYGALKAFACTAEVAAMKQEFQRRRDLIHSLVSDIPGVKCSRPAGAFYLFCDISSFGLTPFKFCERLLDEQKVAGVPGEPFGSDRCIRFSYACSQETIRKAAERLKAFCATLR